MAAIEGRPATDTEQPPLGTDGPPGTSDAAPPASAMPVDTPSMGGAGEDLAAPERPAESFAPVPPAARRSAMPALLAAIGLVLIVMLGLNLYLMANPPGQQDRAALEGQIDGLKQRLGAVEARPRAANAEPQLTDLGTRVAALATAVDTLKAAPPPSPAPAPVDTTRTDALDGKVGTLDQKVDTVANRLGDLDGAVAMIKSTLAAQPKVDLGPLQARTAELATGVDSLRSAIAAVPKVDLGPLEKQVSALEARLPPLEAEVNAGRLRAAPLALTAQAVQRSLDEGRSFEPALKALRNLGAPPEQVSALEPVAATGAPTRAALVAEFAALRPAVVSAGATRPGGTLLDRVMAGAQGLVTVRDAGASPGDDPDAVASRISAALQAGDFTAADQAWGRLPDKSREASAAWEMKLKQRAAADAAAGAISAAAVATFGGTP